MAIGKISGPMLQTNLARQGVDLSVDTNLVYFDVTNRRLGINTTGPTQTLDVPGNVRLANLSILGNTITSDTGKINLGSPANLTITGGTKNYVMSTDGAGNLAWAQISDLDISFGNLSFNDTTLQVTTLNANLYLAANGTGSIGANGAVISNVGYPVASTDAATKGYIDTTLLNFNDDRIVSGTTQVLATAANLTVTSNGVLQAYFTQANTVVNNVKIQNTTISSVTGDLHLAGLSATNKILLDNTSSVKLPVGATADRPASPVTGDFRYNTDSSSIEFYTGSGWLGSTNTLDSQTITGDGVNATFTLSHAATAAGILVSINGTVQQPASAYVVNGNQITFIEVPLSTDVIDIRFLGLTVAPSLNQSIITTANVLASTSATTVDSFSASAYRSVRYTVQASYNTNYQLSDILVVHNGTTAYSTVQSVNTGTNLGTFSAVLTSGNVYLQFTAVNNNTIVRPQATYFQI